MSADASSGTAKRRRRGAKKMKRTDPLEDLSKLMHECSAQNLRGVLRDASVWVLASTSISRHLNACCIGRQMAKDAGLFNGGGESVPTAESSALHRPETFRLSLEEAFFLHYCTGCLAIHRDPDVPAGIAAAAGGETQCEAIPLSTQQCWSAFIGLRSDFLLSYIAYQHFRSKGWIVRSGLYYGCEHVLYRWHPHFIHAQYCVKALNRGDAIGWLDVQSLVRVCVNVKKELIVLFVDTKKGTAGESTTSGDANANASLNDVNMLPLVEVDEFKLSRWTPEAKPTA